MADIFEKTWEALVTDVEKAVDADVKKPHIGVVVKFFMKDVGFAKPSMCNVSESKLLGRDKCPADLHASCMRESYHARFGHGPEGEEGKGGGSCHSGSKGAAAGIGTSRWYWLWSSARSRLSSKSSEDGV